MFKKYLSEFIATFILVFCGTGAIIINEQSCGAITHVGIAATFGLVVLAMIYAFGDISGAHMNPAVSMAFALSGKLSWIETIYYIIAQLAGAFLASTSLSVLFPSSEFLGATLPSGTELQSFVLEVILTFVLMLVIFRVSSGAKEKGIMAGIGVASVVGLEAMFAGPICGASMNPARSLAPALVSGHPEHVWLYLAAPVLGAVLAFLVNKLFSEG